ncbi:MAG: type IX secretion system sortase PorU [Bacteroidota bacterium]
MKRFITFLGVLTVFSFGYAQNYADNSVLSEGKWTKMGIVKPGVYRLEFNDLTTAGLDPNTLNPRNIHIYGNGGGMLPQANSAERPDDLQEVPITVIGEADGRFDPGDAILFYAEGSDGYIWNAESQLLSNEQNLYADTNFYFITANTLPGKRVNVLPSEPTGTFDAKAFRGTDFHEVDLESPIESGRFWLGETFSGALSQRTFSFYVPDVPSTGSVRVTMRVAAASSIPSQFTVTAGGLSPFQISINKVIIGAETSDNYKLVTNTFAVPQSALDGDSLRITLDYASTDFQAIGWLDFIDLDFDQNPTLGPNEGRLLLLADGVGEGEVARVKLQVADASYNVWNVSDPSNVYAYEYNLNGSQLSFNMAADSVEFLYAFKDEALKPVNFIPVPNQNLHGLNPVDYLIISPDLFRAEAQRLGEFHQNEYQRSFTIVSPEQIYNEFSGGKMDVTAIRDFIRMMWVRSANVGPGHILLFGDGTYIYKYISEFVNNERNFIPTYQSRNSWRPDLSFVADDYFVLLDEEDGSWGEGTNIPGDKPLEQHFIDIPIGRLPIETPQEAKEIVDKIIRYKQNPVPEDFGAWRSRIMLVADHKESDGDIHVRQSNGYSSQIFNANACYNLDKLFMDNYQMEITASGERFPDGREALLNSMDQGALIMNYTGHGNYEAWSNAKIFQSADLGNLQNAGKTPAVVTATCEFGRYDDPEKRSGAELMLMKADGGSIAMFTTVRLVYARPNAILNQNFYHHVFDYDEAKGRMPTIGEINMKTKNETYKSFNLNTRAFTLLGDPALILNYPELNAVITDINERPVDSAVFDTVRSLELVQIRGEIQDAQGAAISNFNGDLDVTVFDKPSAFTTIRSNFSFVWQQNRIFNGSASVEEGKFAIDFVVPVDISYENGFGKISLYATDELQDAMGCRTNLVISGTDVSADPDNKGPEVELFMNDAFWREGGVTGPEPFLYAEVFDENGINTANTGIGHEISAFLDDDQSDVFILNEYYTAKPNSYQEGTVKYQLRDLEEGYHKLTIRVWDVANNSSEASTTFIVATSPQGVLNELLSAPNPYNPNEGETRFLINHNWDGKELEAKIEILDLSGREVAELSASFTATGSVFRDLTWDGNTGDNNQVSEGMYVYRVQLTDVETGNTLNKANRLVVIK